MQDPFPPLLGGALQATPLHGNILLQVQHTLHLQSAAGSPGGYFKSCLSLPLRNYNIMASKIPYCHSCKQRHQKPNGLQCPTRLSRLGYEPSAINSDSNHATLELQKTMQEFMKQIDARMSAMESATRRSRSPSSKGDSETQQRRRSISEGGQPKGAKDTSFRPLHTPATIDSKISGRDKTAMDVVTLDIPWPHYYVTSANQRPAHYDELSVEEFVYGYMCVHNQEKDTAIQSAMRKHLCEIMLDSRQYGWEKARSFHALILAQMEQGRLNWLDSAGIQYERQRRGYLPSPPRPKQPFFKAKVEICIPYQAGNCPHDTHHGGLKHVCSYCYKAIGCTFKHPKVSCKRKLDDEAHASDSEGQ